MAAEGRKEAMAAFGPLPGGCHGGLYPGLLPDTQFAAGVNVSVRGGFVRSRPGFRKLLDLGAGTFQGAFIYRLNEGDRLVFVQSGQVKQVKLFGDSLSASTYAVADTTRVGTNGTETQLFSPNFGKDDSGVWSKHVNFVKAERFCVVQDGYHQPAIIGEVDADSARVSFQSLTAYTSPDAESTSVLYSDVPVSLCMAYASGRLIVSPRFLWQDLTGIYPTTPESGRPFLAASDLDLDTESCLRFIETNSANGGGYIRMPQESGFVIGLSPFRNSETVDGNGALLAFCQDGINAFNFAFERSTWGTGKQPISQMLFSGIGTYSPRALVNVNDDIMFRRVDGVGSVRYTASQVAGSSGSLSSTPLSFEVSHRLSLDEFSDLPDVSAAFADNRFLMTTGGKTVDGAGFRGVMSLDTAALYSMANKPSPAYDDIWTGLDFLQVLSARYQGRDRHLLIARHKGTVGLWLVDPAARTDEGTPIFSRFYTRQFTFGDPMGVKRFDKVELWIRDLVGKATIRVYWRSDGSSLWSPAGEVILNAGATGLPQTRRRVTFGPEAENECDTTGLPTRVGTAFQLCVEWEGSLSVERGVLFATPGQSEPNRNCAEEAESVLEAGPDGTGGRVLDDFTYSVK